MQWQLAFKNKRDKRFMKKFTNIFETLEKHFANVQQVYALSLLVFETSGFCIFNTSCVSFCHKDFEPCFLFNSYWKLLTSIGPTSLTGLFMSSCGWTVEHIYDHLSKGPLVSHTFSAHAEARANAHLSGQNSNIWETNWPLGEGGCSRSDEFSEKFPTALDLLFCINFMLKRPC